MLQLLLAVEGMTGSIFRLALVVLLAVLSCCFRAQGDAPSLCSIISVSASGPSWCEFVGMINRTQFFKYSCKNKIAKPVGPLGMTLNATEVWNQRCEHWKDLVEELQKALLDNKENIYEAFSSLSLQVYMMCQQESSGHRKTFWEFGFKRQMCLRFDSKNRRWTELHPGCRSLKETLESDKYVTNLLVLVSDGDCAKLLNQSTVLETEAAPIVATTTGPVPAPSKAVIIKDNIALILTPIFILKTLGI